MDLDSCFICGSKYQTLAQKEVVTLNELIKYPLILPGKTTANRTSIDYKFKENGIVLHPIIETTSSSISRQLILEGLGIGWIIKEFVQEDINNGNLYEVNVDFEQTVTPLSISYNKKFNHKIIKEFIDAFRQNDR